MPRFFFDFDDGDGVVRDGEGVEFPDEAAAIADAHRALLEITGDPASEYLAISIRNEGAPAFIILSCRRLQYAYSPFDAPLPQQDG